MTEEPPIPTLEPYEQLTLTVDGDQLTLEVGGIISKRDDDLLLLDFVGSDAICYNKSTGRYRTYWREYLEQDLSECSEDTTASYTPPA